MSELCGKSGRPLDECDQLHEGNCAWQCGRCGGNVYNCICETVDQEQSDGLAMAKRVFGVGVFMDVIAERQRQNEKWGEQNHDAYRWLAILTEEVGELAQAALHNEFGGRAKGTLRKELVQVAAVAVQWLECIDRNGSES